MDKALWIPSPQQIEQSQMMRFARSTGHSAADYPALLKWSIEHKEAFWSALWDFCEIRGDKGSAPYLIDGDKLPGSRWFPEARLNYAENLLRRRDDKTALVQYKENGQRDSLSYAELYQRVAALAASLRKDGISSGDRIAGYLPNASDTIVAMLACTSIGAIWTSCSPDFGEQGLLDRFGQVEPRILFINDGYQFNGKTHHTLSRADALLEKLPSVERLVVIPYLGADGIRSEHPKAILIDDYLDPDAETLEFTPLPFDHPLFIMYSSGTTGKPKCIVHCAGGVLLEHQKEHVLHTDLREDSVFFYYTTCGWMMWNWLVSGLATGATLVLYDGSPFYPNRQTLLDLIDEEGISIFGTSAKYLAGLQKADLHPAETHSLASLKAILSTGSPLAAEQFQYVYDVFKPDLMLSSIAGGTDLLGAFASGNPCLPVYAGELQCTGLGFELDVLDEEGRSLRGEKGELVCRSSFPSVPLCFWNDPDNEKFHSAYFDRYPGIWAHGDYAEITSHGGLIIHGRSDALLNPGGVRIGTAEIYRQVEKVPEVLESIAVGQNWKDDCRVILFVVLREGVQLDQSLKDKIRATIRANTTPRHEPTKIIQVSDIPRTISGKIVELAVRNVIHGDPVKNTDALANPQALELYRDLEELRY